MAEKIPQQKNAPSKSISDSMSSDEEQILDYVLQPKKGYTAQLEVWSQPLKIKPLPKQKATDQTTQTDTKDKSK